MRVTTPSSDRTRTLPCSLVTDLVADLICRAAEIGLTITGAADAGHITIIDAAPVTVDGLCPECGNPGKLRDHIAQPLADLPAVGLLTRLHVRVPRLTCSYPACGRRIFQASPACADDGAKLTHRVTRWILQRLAIHRMSTCGSTPESQANRPTWQQSWSTSPRWSTGQGLPACWTCARGAAQEFYVARCRNAPPTSGSPYRL